MTSLRTLLAAASLAAAPAGLASAQAAEPIRNVVLVHGAFADGSGWKGVAQILEKDGYHVSVVQEPETTLPDDVAATKRILAQQSGPTVLVGHSYGGAVITEAGDDPHVASLVYVAAFVPDEGETVGGLSKADPGAATSVMPVDGALVVDPAKFPHDFAADVPAAEARYMAISQVPQGIPTATAPITAPAWKGKPAWAIVATEDRMINPQSERSMYARAHAKVTEVKASHAVYVSQPRAVAEVIEKAARGAD